MNTILNSLQVIDADEIWGTFGMITSEISSDKYFSIVDFISSGIMLSSKPSILNSCDIVKNVNCFSSFKQQ